MREILPESLADFIAICAGLTREGIAFTSRCISEQDYYRIEITGY